LADGIMAKIAGNLAQQEPKSDGNRLAAVSMIVSGVRLPSVLLIRRAERPGDPWSGQIAFPGGKMQAGDGSARETAIREAREEVGIDLSQGAEFLGYAEAATTHTGNMNVIPAVFLIGARAEVEANEEVASYRWVELKDLLSPKASSTYELNYNGRSVAMPAYALGDYVVWGLTHRILSSILGNPAKAGPERSRRPTRRRIL
jgi:8-oxo-dGTP pyrophosphatase MutT (NUDIX family)